MYKGKAAPPIEVKPWDVIAVPRMGGTLDVRGLGMIEAGMFLPSIDGERFYHSNADPYIFFLQTKATPGNAASIGKWFYQPKREFAADVSVGGVAGGVIRRTSGSHAVIKTFLDVFIGAMACAGGPLAWGITGMGVFVTAGKVMKNYGAYEDAMVAILASRKQMRDKMPVFYRTVLWELYFGAIEQKLMSQSKDMLSEAVPGPKVAGKLVGVLLGALGEDKFQQRLTALNELFSEVLQKVAKHAMDANQPIGATQIVLSEDQVRQLANLHVKRILATTNIIMPTAAEMDEIVREAARQWTMHSTFKKMSVAIAALG